MFGVMDNSSINGNQWYKSIENSGKRYRFFKDFIL